MSEQPLRRLQLPQVTLICVDTAHPGLAMRAMRYSLDAVDFGAAVFITRPSHGLQDVPPAVEIITTETIRSAADYSLFMLQRLGEYVKTSHFLIVQWDGFVLDPAMWSDSFLEFDYIGAVWPYYSDNHRVGNGGFSLRSRRLLDALLDPEIKPFHPEDRCIARTYRELLERRHTIRFADEPTAHRFAIESMHVHPTAFGFHGMLNLQLRLPPEEFAQFVAEGPGNIFAAHCTRLFVKDAIKQGQIDLAGQALRRRRANRRIDMGDVRLWLRYYKALALRALGAR